MSVSPHVASASDGWMHGRASDLLLGAGLGYIVTIPLLVVAGNLLGTAIWPAGALLIVGLLFNTPHYGATLLRVYERREDRHKYALFAVHGTVLLAVILVAALYSVLFGSIIYTIYLTWSPWHFAGQNYGLSLMFLRRRQVTITAAAKRWIYLSFVFSFALAVTVIHAQASVANFAPGAGADAGVYGVLRLGIPRSVLAVLLPGLVAAYLFSIGASASLLLREGARLRDLVPAALLVLTQALWFSVPAYLTAAGRPIEQLAFSAVWISAAHSVQYLWVTSYYARRTHATERTSSFYRQALLAGSAVFFLPGLLLSTVQLGGVVWSAGLAVLIFSVANIHHFVLDGAIWKLRDGTVARALLRTDPAPTEMEAIGEPRRPWLRPLVTIVGVVALAVPLVNVYAFWLVREHDLPHIERAARSLALIGRDSPDVLSELADQYWLAGRIEDSIRVYRESLDLRRRPKELNNLAWILAVEAKPDPGRAAEAVILAREAVDETGGKRPDQLDTLAVAYAATGRYRIAARIASQAAELARAQGDEATARGIEQRRALYLAGRPYRKN